MSIDRRTFGALIAHDGVCLVEYQAERTGVRVVDQWADTGRSASIDEALDRLLSLLSARNAGRVRLSVAIEQFGVFHHVMMLPGAPDDVLRPVIRREVQRLFSLPDPVVSFTRGVVQERRGPSRADERTAPRQVFIAGAPRETIDSLREKLSAKSIEIDVATVVPKAMHSLYEGTGASLEPTAALVCLEGGPHLAFFLEGRLELAIEPPIALEGERAPVPVIVDQVERGAVYFRQQFRGAVATRMLLAARPSEYQDLSAALESGLGVRVTPLFAGAASPEAVVAMGAVLEAQHAVPLDIFPHPPTLSSRVSAALRGPNAAVGTAVAAAAIAGIWAAAQFTELSSTKRQADDLRTSVRNGIPAVEPIRQIVERRADYAKQVSFIRDVFGERSSLSTSLSTIAQEVPPSVRFDSLRVSRAPAGWSAAIGGEATGATAAQAVRALDAFYQAVRNRAGVTSPTLDQFEYPGTGTLADSARTGAPVVIQFHLSFGLARVLEPVR